MLRNFLCRRWRKASEYKKVLQQLQSHLRQLKNKKQAVSKILRDDITQLIGNNDQTRALVRTKELLIVENLISVYGLMLQFTDVILLRFDHSIKNQRFGKELLDDKINEAVSSLVFASTRCGEELLQPLLLSMREIFGQRYGHLYVSNALELRQGNFVNLKIREKLSKESGLETGLQDMLTVEYHTHEIEKHVIYVEEEKSEPQGKTSRQHKNIENAQKEEEEEGEGEYKVEEEKERRPNHVHPKLPDYDGIVTKLIRAKNKDEEERRRRLLPKHVHPKLPDYDQIVDKEEKSELKEKTSVEHKNIEDAQKEEEENNVEEEKERRPNHVHPKLPDYDGIVAKLIGAKNKDEEERRRRLLPKHVHPKLPDYDQIVDNFSALRT